MNLFNKYFGSFFDKMTRGPAPTLGLNFLLHNNATGNAVTRRLARRGGPVRTMNKSRHLGYSR